VIQAPKNIHPLLKSALSGSASGLEINSLVRNAINFASLRLRQLVRSGRLHLQSFAISVEGVAFDCIAELFQRGENGVFVELEAYFSEDRSLDILDEKEAEHYFRRLVFSQLNEGIYRLYRENDPILGRILRNLKMAVRTVAGFRQFDRLGQTYLHRCSEGELLEELPEYPVEQIQTEMASRAGTKSNAQQYLSLFFKILDEQDQYRRFYALIDIAIVIKRVSVRRSMAIETMVDTDDPSLRLDLEDFLRGNSVELKQILFARYVESGKISAELFECYAHALEDIVFDVFAHNDGADLSHADYLRKYIPDLTVLDYRKFHRTHFEYMVRVAKHRAKLQARELL